MDTPTLFDAIPEPRARHSDPPTAHLAATIVSPGNNELTTAIREAIARLGPATAFTIARHVEYNHPGRWQPDTIRTATARANLTQHPGGTSPGGRPAVLYSL